MVKSKKRNQQNTNLQYLPQISNFGKNYYPEIYQCAKKIIKLSKNDVNYINLLEKHKNFIKQKFDINYHSNKLKEFCL